jgi:hypothetical protein
MSCARVASAISGSISELFTKESPGVSISRIWYCEALIVTSVGYRVVVGVCEGAPTEGVWYTSDADLRARELMNADLPTYEQV